MGYLGTKPNVATTLPNNIVTADKIAAGAVTDPKIAAMAASKLSGQVPDANAPSGSVIQVVNATYSTSVVTASTSLVDTGLSASITPISASSKILVIVNQTITPSTSGSNTFAQFEVLRNATAIYGDYRVNATGQYVHTTPNCSVLDSPATTSSITYKTRFCTGTAIYPVEAQHAGIRTSTITLMEIAG